MLPPQVDSLPTSAYGAKSVTPSKCPVNGRYGAIYHSTSVLGFPQCHPDFTAFATLSPVLPMSPLQTESVVGFICRTSLSHITEKTSTLPPLPAFGLTPANGQSPSSIDTSSTTSRTRIVLNPASVPQSVPVVIGIDRSVPADAADLVYYAAFAVSFVCADDYTILRSVEVPEFRPIITFAGHRGSRRHSSSLRQAPKRGILLRVGAPEERVEPGVEPWAIGHQLCHWYARSIQCTLLTNEWSFAESRIPIKPMTPMPLVSSSELISVHHRQSRRTQSEPRNRNRNRLNVNCHHAYVFPVAQPASDPARIVILRHHPAALQRQA